MNLKQVQALSDEELKVKVAELCGWGRRPSKHPQGTGGQWPWVNSAHECLCVYDDWNLPSYPRDLNAMHEAEKMIPDLKWDAYFGYVTQDGYWSSEASDASYALLTATARQRAEAFVLVMQNEEQDNAH